MKWLWIGFAIVWAISVVLDGRRRNRAPQALAPDAEPPPAAAKAPIPALLTAKVAPSDRESRAVNAPAGA